MRETSYGDVMTRSISEASGWAMAALFKWQLGYRKQVGGIKLIGCASSNGEKLCSDSIGIVEDGDSMPARACMCCGGARDA